MISSLKRIVPVTSPWYRSLESVEVSSAYPCMLICGDEVTCKTALLFQCALSYAAEGYRVVFICQKPFTSMPPTVHGMPRPDPAVVSQLKIMYMSSADELVRYLSSVHVPQTATLSPQIVLVDDLHFYIEQSTDHGQAHSIAKMSALLLDFISYLNLDREKQNKKVTHTDSKTISAGQKEEKDTESMSEHTEKCALIMTTKVSNKLHIPVYQRFLKNLWKVQKVKDKGDGDFLTFSSLPIKDQTSLVFKLQKKDSLHLIETYRQSDKPDR